MLERIPAFPPEIKPVAKGFQRPLWSVMIPVYNCSQFIPDVLQSVLNQHISRKDMQIEVVDDASTDANVEKIVKEIGQGRIKYFRQSKNVGSLRNFETCINRSRGQFIHLLHGDDRVLPGYYQSMQRLFSQYPEAGAAYCNFRYIDEEGLEKFRQPLESDKDGLLKNWLLRIAERNLIQYVAISVKREVYEALGSFYGLTYGEDWEMWVRIARNYPFAYTPELLAEYRQHNASITGNSFITGLFIEDDLTSMEIFLDYLPVEPSMKKEIHKRAKLNLFNYAFYISRKFRLEYNDNRTALLILYKSLNLSDSYFSYFKVLLEILKIKLKCLFKTIKGSKSPLKQLKGDIL